MTVRGALPERDQAQRRERTAIAAAGPGPTEYFGVGRVSAAVIVVPCMLTSRGGTHRASPECQRHGRLIAQLRSRLETQLGLGDRHLRGHLAVVLAV